MTIQRNLDPAVVTNILSDVTRNIILVRLDFASGLVLTHNRLGEVIYDSGFGPESYLGIGDMGTISQLSEGSEVKPYSTKLTIQGFDPSLVATALADDYQGRAASIFLGALDEDNNLISSEPFFKINYRINYMEGSIDGQKASLTVVLQTRLSDWARNIPGRYTDQYQKSIYPNDKGLEFISEMADKEINWGRDGGSAFPIPGPFIIPNLG